MKKIFVSLLLTLFFSFAVRSQTENTSANSLQQMIKYFNAGKLDSAYLITDASINNLELKNNPKFWFYCGLIYKEMFKKYEKGDANSKYREKSSQSYQITLASETDADIINDIKKNLKYLAATYYNDAIRLLKEEKTDIPLSIYVYTQYLELMKQVDENFNYQQKEIEFSLALGSVYAKMFDSADNIMADEYYFLAKKCYEKVLALDPAQSSARYNIVVLETKLKTRHALLLKEESIKKDKEILALQAIKELADVKLRQSELEDEANKKGLIILKNQQEKYQMRTKAEQEKKDAIVQKEKQDQQILLWSVISGLFVVVVIAGLIYRGSRQKQKTNKIITAQKEEVEKSYQNTKLLSEIGQKITASLSVDDITEKVYKNVNQLMDASAFGIGIFNEVDNHISFPGFIEKGETLPFSYDELSEDNRLSVLCFKNQREIFINDLENDYNKYFPGKDKPKIIVGESPESIIYLPLSVPNKHIGVITVQSFKKGAYSDYHLNILRNLAVYVSIALDNSGAYNKLNTALEEVEKLSFVVSKSTNTVMIFDANTELEWVNNTFLDNYGSTLEEFKKERGSKLIDISGSQEIESLFKECISKKIGVSYESVNVTNKLGKRWFQSMLSPIFDEAGDLQNLLVIDSDITTLKQIEEELRQKNKDITDSILYAKRIQQSILPSDKKIKESLPESFIFYQPKDIVSGDFYWMESLENNSRIIVAAVDCTGHGVPGALLTIMGNDLLNHIVNEIHIYDPKDILKEMNIGIINRFDLLEDSSSREGMDMALISIHKTKGKTTLHFSGAYNSMFYIRDGELFTLNAMRQHIGAIPENERETILSHTIEILKGDVVYIFSDGYADQISDKTGKKFMKGRFKDLLIDIHQKPMAEQKIILEKTHIHWRGNTFQTDDMLVMGFKF